MNPISSTSEFSLFNRYEEDLNKVANNAENQPIAVINAFVALQNNQKIEKKGLTISSKEILQNFSAKIKKSDFNTKQKIKNELQEKIKGLFKSSKDIVIAEKQDVTTFCNILINEELICHISSFGDKKFKDDFSLVSKEIKHAINKEIDRQILTLFRLVDHSFLQIWTHWIKSIWSSSELLPLPLLQFPRDFDIEQLSIQDFSESMLLPKCIDYEKILKGLFRYAEFIKSGSDQEKLILYLMKHFKWNASKVLEKKWPEGSSIRKIALDVSEFFELSLKNHAQENLELVNKVKNSDLIKYPYSYAEKFQYGMSLAEWALMNYPFYTDKREIALLAAQIPEKGKTEHTFPAAIKDLSEDLQNDREVAKAFVKRWARSFIDISDDLKKDEEIVWEAILIDPFLVKFAYKDIQTNKVFILKYLKHVSSRESYNDKSIGLSLIDHLPTELQNDEDVKNAVINIKRLMT